MGTEASLRMLTMSYGFQKEVRCCRCESEAGSHAQAVGLKGFGSESEGRLDEKHYKQRQKRS